jgi:uncharacterized protein Yka (UPF0111/DUF47 family)
MEHTCHEIRHETLRRLSGTFETPLESEDIRRLADQLDAVLHYIDKAVNRMMLYRIDAPTENARALAACLRRQTESLAKTMPHLRDIGNLSETAKLCGMVRREGAEADLIHQRALAALFADPLDDIYVIKWKDIYDDLKAASDSCEGVANVLEEDILMKDGLA